MESFINGIIYLVIRICLKLKLTKAIYPWMSLVYASL